MSAEKPEPKKNLTTNWGICNIKIMGKKNTTKPSTAGEQANLAHKPLPRLTILQADVPGHTIADQLRTVRHALGIDIHHASRATGVSTATLWQIETGRVPRPSARLIKKIADGYGVRVVFFLKTIGLKISKINTR